MNEKIWDGILKALGVFDIFWAFVFFFLLIGSQLGFLCGLLLGIFYIMSGSGILRKSLRARKRYLIWITPLSVLGVLNLIPFTNPKMPQGFRMDSSDIVQFTCIFIIFPLVLNILVLTRGKTKERFQ
jgi:hypothetical protein